MSANEWAQITQGFLFSIFMTHKHKPRPQSLSTNKRIIQVAKSAKRLSITEIQQRHFYIYQQGAEKRQLDFLITFDEFKNLWHRRCTYCNSEIRTIGIDRVDNKKGYIKENIVACCTSCNSLKGRFSLQEFLSQCLAVTEYQRRKNATQAQSSQVNGETI